jgi:hypothetical protein
MLKIDKHFYRVMQGSEDFHKILERVTEVGLNLFIKAQEGECDIDVNQNLECGIWEVWLENFKYNSGTNRVVWFRTSGYDLKEMVEDAHLRFCSTFKWRNEPLTDEQLEDKRLGYIVDLYLQDMQRVKSNDEFVMNVNHALENMVNEYLSYKFNKHDLILTD